MNYTKIYEMLITKARNRTIFEGYGEIHHVIPRCLGGTDDVQNLVKLTPEEHYIAHLLLVKMNPRNTKLLCAAVMMAGQDKYHSVNNKKFGWLRRQYSEYNPMKRSVVAMKVAKTRRERGNLGRNSTPVSEKEKLALSERMKSNNPCAGIPPWRSPKVTLQSIEVWKNADAYYQWWCVNKKGYCAMATAFGFKDWLRSHASMVEKFKSGWIPREDPDWLSWLV